MSDDILNALQTSLNTMRAQYRKIRGRSGAAEVKLKIGELEKHFETILLSDMKRLSKNPELIANLKLLIKETDVAIDKMEKVIDRVEKVASVIDKINDVLKIAADAARQVL